MRPVVGLAGDSIPSMLFNDELASRPLVVGLSTGESLVQPSTDGLSLDKDQWYPNFVVLVAGHDVTVRDASNTA